MKWIKSTYNENISFNIRKKCFFITDILFADELKRYGNFTIININNWNSLTFFSANFQIALTKIDYLILLSVHVKTNYDSNWSI